MLTELQKKMIIRIAEDQFGPTNGSPKCAEDTATFMVVETPEDKGVFTSLKRIGLVWFQSESKKGENDEACGLTEAGWQKYIEIKGE